MFLYLEAKVKSQDLSRFYTKLGSSVLETKLIINHLDYLFNKCGWSRDFILDAASVFDVWDKNGYREHAIRVEYLTHTVGMVVMPHIYPS